MLWKEFRCSVALGGGEQQVWVMQGEQSHFEALHIQRQERSSVDGDEY